MDIKEIKLTDKDLNRVAGGSSGGSSVTIVLTIPCAMTEDVKIMVYVDGVLDRGKTIIASGISSKAFTFTGTGKSQVKFKLNDTQYMLFEIDFDSGSYIQL